MRSKFQLKVGRTGLGFALVVKSTEYFSFKPCQCLKTQFWEFCGCLMANSVANSLLSLLAEAPFTAASNGFSSWLGCWLPVAVSVIVVDWRPPNL